MIQGRYFDGRSSRPRSAQLAEREGKCFLRVEGEERAVEVVITGITDRIGSVPRKITFEDLSVFETEDQDAVDALKGGGSRFFKALFTAENSLKLVVISVLAVGLLLVGLYRYGVPAAASFAASVTPPAVVDLMDAGVLSTVDQTLFDESELPQARQSELTGLFDDLMRVSGEDDRHYQLLFRDGGEIGANAIALPGGTIILTDQLVELAKSDEEIAGVLAHEIGHVVERHSLKQIYRVLGIAFMISVIGGDSGQMVEEVVSQASLLQTLSYSREFENEADAHSVELMMELGMDATAFVDLLDRIYEDAGLKPGKTNWLSTHPGNEDRRDAVTARIKAARDEAK